MRSILSKNTKDSVKSSSFLLISRAQVCYTISVKIFLDEGRNEMDEIRFVNEYIRDKSVAKETYGWWFFKRPIMIVLYSLIGFYSVLVLATIIFLPETEHIFTSVIVLVAYALYLGMMLFSYRSQVKMMDRRDRELSHGAPLVCKVEATDTSLVFYALESRQSVMLCDIKYAFITEGYISVITNARLMYTLKKDAFTLGDAESFVAYLREKGIKVKGKLK